MIRCNGKIKLAENKVNDLLSSRVNMLKQLEVSSVCPRCVLTHLNNNIRSPTGL